MNAIEVALPVVDPLTSAIYTKSSAQLFVGGPIVHRSKVILCEDRLSGVKYVIQIAPGHQLRARP